MTLSSMATTSEIPAFDPPQHADMSAGRKIHSVREIGIMGKKSSLLLVGILLAAIVSAGDLYKWTDDKGAVHYSDQLPPKTPGEKLRLPPPPSQQQSDEAQRRAERLTQDADRLLRERHSTAPAATPLGPLPPAEESAYVSTKGAYLVIRTEGPLPRFSFVLDVQLNDDLPVGTSITAYFDDPANPGSLITDTKKVMLDAAQVKQVRMVLASREFDTIRCAYYGVLVEVNGIDSEHRILGVHRQQIQSRIDSELVTSPEKVLQAARPGGLCP